MAWSFGLFAFVLTIGLIGLPDEVKAQTGDLQHKKERRLS